jgi:hypothetical protein
LTGALLISGRSNQESNIFQLAVNVERLNSRFAGSITGSARASARHMRFAAEGSNMDADHTGTNALSKPRSAIDTTGGDKKSLFDSLCVAGVMGWVKGIFPSIFLHVVTIIVTYCQRGGSNKGRKGANSSRGGLYLWRICPPLPVIAAITVSHRDDSYYLWPKKSGGKCP